MNRAQWETYILAHYEAETDCPWPDSPENRVFRHRVCRKWFALMMSLPENRLGLPGETVREVINLKCDPRLLGSLLQEPGFFPAYHMNKEHWVTVLLDGSAAQETVKWLLDLSFELTMPHPRVSRSRGTGRKTGSRP